MKARKKANLENAVKSIGCVLLILMIPLVFYGVWELFLLVVGEIGKAWRG